MSEFKRQHPAAAVDQLFTLIRKNLVTFIILFFLSTRGNGNSIFLYIFFGSLVLSLVTGFLGWWLFTYRVHNDELQIKKGILVRKNLYLSKERIQVIDLTEGIVQRLFGLVKLEVKTAGSGTETATINAISRDEAERLRAELRGRSTTEVVAEVGEQSVDVIDDVLETWKLSKRDLMMAAITSGNFGLIASILGAISGQLDSFITEENLDYVIDHLPGASNVTLVIAVIVAIIVISWTLSFLGIVLKYSDFKVERTATDLIITSGLIERKHITVPYNRIQAIRFVEGVLRQPLGYGALYVESAGFEIKENERSITLLPYISKHEIQTFFKTFLPEYEQNELTIKPPKKALFKYIRRPNYLFLLLLPIAWYLFDYGWGILIFIPFFMYLGWVQFRDVGLNLSQNILTIRYRSLARVTAFIKQNRIQTIGQRVNPLQARRDLASLTVTAASGAKGIEFKIRDLDAGEVIEALNWAVDKRS